MNAPQNGGEGIDVMEDIAQTTDHYKPEDGVVYYLEKRVD